MRSVVVYTLARLGLFLAIYAGIWLLLAGKVPFDAISGLWTALVAMVVSSLIALFALRGLRGQVSADIAARAERIRRASAARAQQQAREDAGGVQQFREPRVPQDSDQL